MEIKLTETGILELKALTVSRNIFRQLPIYRRFEARPEILGWVNCPDMGEWYVAETEGRPVRVSRTEMWEFFGRAMAKELPRMGGVAALNGVLNRFRDKLPQIFLK